MAREIIEVGFTHVPVRQSAHKSFDCAELTFINKGANSVTIDGCFPLAQNESITYPCFDIREKNRTVYDIVFAAGSGNDNNLIAICKNIMS